jgi:hypothetical protein
MMHLLRAGEIDAETLAGKLAALLTSPTLLAHPHH